MQAYDTDNCYVQTLSDIHIGASHAAVEKVVSQDPFWQKNIDPHLQKGIERARAKGLDYHLVLNGDIFEFVVPSRRKLEQMLSPEELAGLQERLGSEPDEHIQRTEYEMVAARKFYADLIDTYLSANPDMHLHVTLGNHDAALEYWHLLEDFARDNPRFHIHQHQVSFGELTVTHGDSLYDNPCDIFTERELHPKNEMYRLEGYVLTAEKVAQRISSLPMGVGRHTLQAMNRRGCNPLGFAHDAYGTVARWIQPGVDWQLNYPAKVSGSVVELLQECAADLASKVRHIATGHVHTPHADMAVDLPDDRKVVSHNSGSLTYGSIFHITKFELERGKVINHELTMDTGFRIANGGGRGR